MPSLDLRLQAVFELIEADTHADIGSDHAYLPLALIQSRRVKRCVVVELNPGPLERARKNVALAGAAAQIEVRQGNGFAPLLPGEVQSASLSGMGASTVLGVLDRAGNKLPPALVLQPNDSARPLRVWARENGYHLAAETLAGGYWAYPVLRLERRAGADPAYDGLPLTAALHYGPQLLRSGNALLREQILSDIARLTPVAAPGRPAQAELETAWAAQAFLD